MPETPVISVVIPAYNEAEGIPNLLEKIVELGYHKSYEIIVVDDGSSDETAEIVKQFPVRLISHHTNKGYGAALKTGIRKAKGQKIIMLDSDGQHDPEYIPQIAALLEEHELVIGERTSDSFQVKNRQGGKKLIRKVGEYLFDQKLPDFNSGLRGFDRELIKAMLHMMPNGFSFSTTSTMAFIKEGYSIGTLPIMVAERQGRPSNVKFVRDGSKTMLLLFRIIMLFNPLKIFFPFSVVVVALGVMWGIYAYIFAGRFANSATLVTMLGMFLFFIGLIADQIAIMNRRVS
jgi:glycosyltransferase involved in cell wall biosynthesis